jgi:chromosome segregation ATPase
MAGATTFHDHNEGYEDFRDEQNNPSRNDQGIKVETLFTSALNSLVVQKHEEIEQLKRKIEEFHRRFESQDKVIEGLKQKIIELEEEVNTLKQKFRTCTKDLTGTVKKLREIELTNETLARKVEVLQGDKNILYLGEMCRKLQENVYRYVFPDKVKISSLVSLQNKKPRRRYREKKKINKRREKRSEETMGTTKARSKS